MRPLDKRAITPIIAVILIVMITVAAAGAMFFWLTRIQNQGQGQAEQSQSVLLERVATCVDIPGMTFNLLDNISSMSIQNCGTTDLDLGDGDDNILITSDSCSFLLNCTMVVSNVCPIDLLPGAFTRIDLNFSKATCSGSARTAADVLSSEESIQHQIILSVDRKSTAARTFIPQEIS